MLVPLPSTTVPLHPWMRGHRQYEVRDAAPQPTVLVPVHAVEGHRQPRRDELPLELLVHQLLQPAPLTVPLLNTQTQSNEEALWSYQPLRSVLQLPQLKHNNSDSAPKRLGQSGLKRLSLGHFSITKSWSLILWKSDEN